MKMVPFVALLLPCALAAQPVTPTKSKLVGIWQCSHEMAAGWNEAFQLFANGKVIWHANQMDLQKRLISREGTWALNGSNLTVTFTSELATVGGKLIPGSGGDGESDIQGGKDMVRKLEKPIVKTYKLSQITKRENYPSMLFGSRRFWQMRTDPKDYN